SGLVLQQHSPRRAEVKHLAAISPAEFSEFSLILDVFDTAYDERVAAIDIHKKSLSGLTPLELLVYASLYAFEHLVPRHLLPASEPVDPDTSTEVAWDAINDLLIWKLGTADVKACRLTENDIGRSLAKHLSPFLFPSQDRPGSREDLYRAFEQLLAAQIELNSFISRSADAFSYDDSIAFVPKDGRLEIVEHDPAMRAAWERNGKKHARLHYYWYYRAVDTVANPELTGSVLSRLESHEANLIAYIKAMRTRLQLTEVYGLAETVTTETGLRVNLFQALLSLELMTAFFNIDFMQPYMKHLGEMGNSRMALGRLAFGGLMKPGMHNRFPITWSDRTSKIANITGWTVSENFPHGNPKAAEAILDFWTSDWASLATRLHKQEAGLNPELFERPILKMGRYLFQLPWLVAMQNNASAAINNLRRIGSQRVEARDETRRIEEQLGKLFEEKGFRVQLNFEPERIGDDNPGEVDLICVRDGLVLVLEIKSSFLRRSQKDAWLHGVTTLRKAGLQLRRKVQAIQNELTTNTDLASTLGIETDATQLPFLGWIVDTSIEHDHDRFNGFLKVSLEEVLIALRDDRHLLNDPDGLINGTWKEADRHNIEKPDNPPTLYPNGFSAPRFIEVIESEAVWKDSVPS
ncbi:MAG TPA: hypothetical protein VET88_08900, partial [Gammaproteobacteria bacterium]|nr:hypothetical protein [Gammaproteobacteria bacterium]